MQYMGSEYVPRFHPSASPLTFSSSSGYLQSCRDIVTCARHIANTITASIPELYVLGSPPASVVAFGSRDTSVNAYEVGDRMAKRGWHLNALSGPAAVHIACTVRCVDSFLVVCLTIGMGIAVDVASRGDVHFRSQGFRGGGEEVARGQRVDGGVVRYVGRLFAFWFFVHA